MGIALTLGLNQTLGTAVKDYFKKFKTLPPKGLTVSNTKNLTGAHSFETLLKGIIAEKSETDFVIVVHGHETGNGLFLKLATRAGGAFGSETTNEMLQILMDIEARTPPAPAPGKPATPTITPEERKKLGELTDAEINRLIDLMKQVRAKNLKLVEFRGCNLGRLPISVERFRKFLGAQTFGAPKLHSFFGTFQMKASPGIMTAHTTSHTGTTFTYPQIFAGSPAACCFATNTDKKPESGHLVAPDTTTLDAWIKANLDPAASSGTDTTLPIHGLWEFPPKLNGAPFDPDPRPIFPLGVVAVGTNKVNVNEYKMNVRYNP